MSSWTRMGLVLVVDLNWFVLNKFALSLDCIVTPLSQVASAQSRTLERKREKRVGARTQPCFTPFCTTKGLDSSPFRLTGAFMFLCREAMRSTSRSGQLIFCSIFQSISLCTNAFVKSTSTMYRGLFCSMHFSWIWERKSCLPFLVWDGNHTGLQIEHSLRVSTVGWVGFERTLYLGWRVICHSNSRIHVYHPFWRVLLTGHPSSLVELSWYSMLLWWLSGVLRVVFGHRAGWLPGGSHLHQGPSHC